MVKEEMDPRSTEQYIIGKLSSGCSRHFSMQLLHLRYFRLQWDIWLSKLSWIWAAKARGADAAFRSASLHHLLRLTINVKVSLLQTHPTGACTKLSTLLNPKLLVPNKL